jgi:hypothetical protein
MSLAPTQPLVPRTIVESVINFSDNHLENAVGVVKGPLAINTQKISPTSTDTTSDAGEVNFHIFSSSRSSVAMNRNLHISYDMTVTINYKSNTADIINLLPLVGKSIAPTSFPLASALSSVTVDFDGTSYQLSMDNWYLFLKHLWHTEESSKTYDSMAPVLLDNSVFYDEADFNNPLKSFSEIGFDAVPPRGSLSPEIVKNITATNTSQGVLVLKYSFIECIPMSPMGTSNTPGGTSTNSGFVGFSNLKLKLAFASNLLNRCMKINPYATKNVYITYKGEATADPGAIAYTPPALATSPGTLELTELKGSVVFGNFKCHATFNTLSPLTSIPPSVNYSYNNIVYFVEDKAALTEATIATKCTPSATTNINSQNYQLSAMPHKVVICAVPKFLDNKLVLVSGKPAVYNFAVSDFYLPIYQISCTLGNSSGLCASYTPEQLYLRSLKNGVRYIPWQASGLSGRYVQSKADSLAYPYGCPLVLGMATDIYTSDLTVAPGVSQNTNFQYQVSIYNYFNVAIAYKLITVFIYEGVLTIGAQSSFNYAFLTREDVINSDSNGIIDASDLSNPVEMSGGSLWSNLKKYGRKTLKFVKSPEFRNAVKSVLDAGESLNIPGVSQAATIAEKGLQAVDAIPGGRLMNMQQGGRLMNSQGGAVIAGGAQTLTASQLRRRLVK